jgi:hypothetical protein
VASATALMYLDNSSSAKPMLPAILLRQLRQEFEPRPIGLRGHLGWTIGGGVEYAFTNNVSAKLEGLYVDLDDDDALERMITIFWNP